ncbi:hypothetical protein PCASD_24305 [Puccinia coronata f. sp. avenae]|uniref:Uncharacterized protein n=1 Tax=Puccinia coronata f. sp. avenae TaxID=200324 RepID=A0A2N5S9D8_9BASI|nr:hypothetical protein PCASD_24305 [Puccinia coronata f. sp. avenae]
MPIQPGLTRHRSRVGFGHFYSARTRPIYILNGAWGGADSSLGLARVSADWELRAITNHSLGLGLIRTYPLDEANACWYGPPRMRMAGTV